MPETSDLAPPSETGEETSVGRAVLKKGDRLARRVRELEDLVAEQSDELRQRDEVIREMRDTLEVLESSIFWTILHRFIWPVTGFLFPAWLRRVKPFRLFRSGVLVGVNKGTAVAWHLTAARLRGGVRQLVEGGGTDGAVLGPTLPDFSAVFDMRIGSEATAIRPIHELRPVTIVICVYNALDDVTSCVESVKLHTDLGFHRVVIVNDASTETGISELLEKVREEGAGRITVLENPEQLGYVKSSNRGMKERSEDVILLNSDTVVTAGWVEKLQKAAYSSYDVATVTPFTNHGVACSVPEFGQYNPIPTGHSIDSFSALVETLSRREYPEIPTAVGFCCYVKRDVIESIGYFDEEAFELGYGEEVDFSFRAVDDGFRHILDDSTFIYHRGGASFGQEEKIACEARATDQIWKMYPKLMADAQVFLRTNPLKPFQDRIRFVSSAPRSHRDEVRVLQVGPYGFEASIGGSVLHTEDLVEALRNEPEHQVSMIYPLFPDVDGRSGYVFDRFDEAGVDRALISCNRPIDRVFYSTPEHPVPMGRAARHNIPEPVENPEIERFFSQVLRLFDIDVVHFQHFLGGYPVSLLETCRDLGVATVVSVHDYFCFCHNFTLFENPDKVFCGFSTDADRCRACLSHHWRVDKGFQARRRSKINHYLAMASRIVVPSEFLREKFLELHSTVEPGRCTTIPHAMSIAPTAWKVPESEAGGPLRAAYLGFFGVEKGSRSFADVVEMMADDDDIEWFIFGEIRDWDSLRRVRSAVKVVAPGRYDRNELPGLLAKHRIDVGLLLSGWPETYSYTLSEFKACRVPVVGFDVGALGHRLRHEGGGIVVPLDRGPAGVAATLEELSADRERLAGLRQNWAPPTKEANAKRYVELYIKVLEEQRDSSPPEI